MCWERLIKLEQPAASKPHPMPSGFRLEPPPARRADAEVKELKKAEEVTAEPLIGIPA